MAVSAGMIAKAAATVLSNEKLRKGVGWTLVAILSPIIVLIALLCSIGSGGADHNNQAVAASFYGVSYSTEVPAEFRHHIEEMRTAFSLLDSAVASVNGQTESGNGLVEVEPEIPFANRVPRFGSRPFFMPSALAKMHHPHGRRTAS
mgnify:CR=1 FL=1